MPSARSSHSRPSKKAHDIGHPYVAVDTKHLVTRSDWQDHNAAWIDDREYAAHLSVGDLNAVMAGASGYMDNHIAYYDANTAIAATTLVEYSNPSDIATGAYIYVAYVENEVKYVRLADVEAQ